MMLAGGEEVGTDGGDTDTAGGTSQRAHHGQSDSIHNGDAANTHLHGPTMETVDNVDTFDVESWVASLRPSADYLNAGAAFVGSDELLAHKRMLRCVGEFSASQMLGEKAGARPGADAATDAAWQYAAENPEQLSHLIEEWVAAAPPVCKKDVESLLTWLVSPLGLPYLRAFACELRRATATRPHGTVTDAAADHSLPVNWSACWAWCVQHSSHLLFTWVSRGSDRRALMTHLCLAGTATSRRSRSARCTWLGLH